MGCHTWIYKNVNSIPKKELDEILKNEIEHSYFSFIEEDKETFTFPKEEEIEDIKTEQIPIINQTSSENIEEDIEVL